MHLVHRLNKFTTFLGVKLIWSYFKQLPLNYTLILKLYHFSFGETQLVRGSIFSIDNPLDSHSTIVSVRPAGIVKVLKIGRNIKKFCDPLLIK